MVVFNQPMNVLALEALDIRDGDSVLEIGFRPGHLIMQEARFTDVAEMRRAMTPFGTLSLYRAVVPAQRRADK